MVCDSEELGWGTSLLGFCAFNVGYKRLLNAIKHTSLRYEGRKFCLELVFRFVFWEAFVFCS